MKNKIKTLAMKFCINLKEEEGLFKPIDPLSKNFVEYGVKGTKSRESLTFAEVEELKKFENLIIHVEEPEK